MVNLLKVGMLSVKIWSQSTDLHCPENKEKMKKEYKHKPNHERVKGHEISECKKKKQDS